MSHDHEDNSECCATSSTKWYKNKTLILAALLTLSVLISYSISFLVPFRNSLLMYINTVWWAILLGLFIGGIIDNFIPKEYVSHVLARSKKTDDRPCGSLWFFNECLFAWDFGVSYSTL